MARGKTSIYFKGGKSDGRYIEDISTLGLAETLQVFSGSAFTDEPDGQVGIVTDLECLPSNWISYKALIYTKTANDKHKEGVVYEFREELMVDRCDSQTKAGSRCKNEARDGSKFCSTHARMLGKESSIIS